MARDYTSAPVSDQLGLGGVIAGLVADLEALRAGSITVPDAMARSMLAKQIFNGVRIYMNGTKYLADAAATVHPAKLSANSPSNASAGKDSA